jgi:hypothetical protein
MEAYEEVLQWLLESWEETKNKGKADKLWRICKAMKIRHDEMS